MQDVHIRTTAGYVAVCQAMAIYLTSWRWPEVFSDFASQMTFLFSFRLKQPQQANARGNVSISNIIISHQSPQHPPSKHRTL